MMRRFALSSLRHFSTSRSGAGGFTLVEVMISIGVFAIVMTVISGLYVDSFRESRRATIQNQLYEDARFIMARIADEIRSGTIDYDEYYNQYVVLTSLRKGVAIPGASNLQTYGQNFGRYYSSFFNPGDDEALGYDCNTVGANPPAVGQAARDDERNRDDCVPLRRTLDRNTGQNPFIGKDANGGVGDKENAFCGTVSYRRNAFLRNIGITLFGNLAACRGDRAPTQADIKLLPELYLISGDARQKTMLARERIGGIAISPIYALSLLRMEGRDVDNDGVIESFICAPEFNCRGTGDVAGVNSPAGPVNDCPSVGNNLPGEVPRRPSEELYPSDANFNDLCDKPADGFVKDFVPISPLRVNVSRLQFLVSPLEDPYYAFGEAEVQQQPRVTVILTIEPNPEVLGSRDDFQPFTLVETIESRVAAPIPAPILVRP